MKKILILGAEILGQIVADALLQPAAGPPACKPLGFLDDDPRHHGRTCLGLPVLGPLAALAELPHEGVVVALDDNRDRSKLINKLLHQGEHVLSVVHPAARLGGHVTVGLGCVVASGALVGPGTTLGPGAFLDSGCILGCACQVGTCASIGAGAVVGFEAHIGALAVVGAGANIIQRQRIGNEAHIAPQALVVRDVPYNVSVLAAVSTVSN